MNIDYLGDASEDDLPKIKVPYFLHTVRVGWPSPADDYVERPIDLNEYPLARSIKTITVH